MYTDYTDNTDFLLVNNYQKLSNNFICTQITQITLIFVGQQLPKIIQKFYLYTDYTDNTDFFVGQKLPKIIQQFYLYTDYTDNTDFLLVNNYQKLSNNKKQ